MPEAPAQPHAARYAIRLAIRCRIKGRNAETYWIAWTRDLS